MDAHLKSRRDVFSKIIDNMQESMLVMALADVGAFQALRMAPSTAEVLAQKLEVQAFHLSRFLNAAVGLGFLRKDGDLYAVVPGDEPLFDPEGDLW